MTFNIYRRTKAEVHKDNIIFIFIYLYYLPQDNKRSLYSIRIIITQIYRLLTYNHVRNAIIFCLVYNDCQLLLIRQVFERKICLYELKNLTKWRVREEDPKTLSCDVASHVTSPNFVPLLSTFFPPSLL